MYKKKQYFVRSKLKSFPKKESSHVKRAKYIYKTKSILPANLLSKKTGCSLEALRKIVSKDFSSGSRPNQSAQSWGIARLASSITGGKASRVDLEILKNGCDHNKMAYKFAIKYGHPKFR